MFGTLYQGIGIVRTSVKLLNVKENQNLSLLSNTPPCLWMRMKYLRYMRIICIRLNFAKLTVWFDNSFWPDILNFCFVALSKTDQQR